MDTHANVIAGASSGLQLAAIELGAEVIVLLDVDGNSQVEVTWLLGRSRELSTQSRGLLTGAVGATGSSVVVAAGSGLATLLRDSISENSRSFLLFPWRGRQKIATGIIGFIEAIPPVSEVPRALADGFNLLGWATWSAKEIARLREELKAANERLAGRKLVERAKSALQAERSITEEQAYEYLRGLSRKRRITLAELSAEILGGRTGRGFLSTGNREP